MSAVVRRSVCCGLGEVESIGYRTMPEIEAIPYAFDGGLVLCTVTDYQREQKDRLLKAGWRSLSVFRNPRTNHKITLMGKRTVTESA